MECLTIIYGKKKKKKEFNGESIPSPTVKGIVSAGGREGVSFISRSRGVCEMFRKLLPLFNHEGLAFHTRGRMYVLLACVWSVIPYWSETWRAKVKDGKGL